MNTLFRGKYVRQFEAKWSKSINIKFSVSVNSATSAITTALLANDISPGDEVITTPISLQHLLLRLLLLMVCLNFVMYHSQLFVFLQRHLKMLLLLEPNFTLC